MFLFCLLWGRVSVRPSCLRTMEPSKEQPTTETELGSCKKVDCFSVVDAVKATSTTQSLASESNSEFVNELELASSSAVSVDVSSLENELSSRVGQDMNVDKSLHSSGTVEVDCDRSITIALNSEAAAEDSGNMNAIHSDSSTPFPMEISDWEKDSSCATNSKAVAIEDSVNAHPVNGESSDIFKNVKVNGTIYSFPGMTASTNPHKLKRESPLSGLDDDNRNRGVKRAEITDSY